MPPRLAAPVLAALVAIVPALPAVAQDRARPVDRTQRGGALERNLEVPLPFPLGLLAPRRPAEGTRDWHRTDPGLGALHARNRYGTRLTCIPGPCGAMEIAPVSPENRAALMKRGVRALPPDAPVFQRPPAAAD
ncbi:MAG TPA: hypothetical protein PKD10_09930 [Paracoccaceae bacterium]|mgnify:CR=1 FL=1|nr:hypothetical protein [Paracoccaceae bacterium]